MDIQVQTSMTIALTLTEDEARAILADPKPFQRDLRAALAQQHAPKANRPFVTRESTPRASGADKVQCPHCEMQCSQKGLGIHIARKHGARVPVAD